MLDRIIQWSIQNRLLAVSAAGVTLVFGTVTAIRMPVDVFPDLTAPTVTVITEAHGMAPEEVEISVTFPIETAVNGATGVRRVRSSTSHGISIVWVEFDWGSEVFRARQIVSEKIQNLAGVLPEGAGPPVLAPVSSIMGEIMLIAVTGDSTVSTMDLRTVADWTIRRRLLAVPGVSQVIPLGGEVRQYQIRVDPVRLAARDVTLDDVVLAASHASANASGGIITDAGQEFMIRGIGRVRHLSDVEMTVVARRGGNPVFIRDVAEVAIGGGVPIGRGSANAEPAVVLTVQKQPETNTIELTDRIDAALAELQSVVPPGVLINHGIFRQADFIEVAVSNVMESLRDGAVLVVLILFLFLWNARTTFISVLAIPLSLVVAVFILEVAGITINTMTLGGMAIAIGALVDDAVIDIENVFRRLRLNAQLPVGEQLPPGEVIYRASREIRASIVTATLIIMVVFLPLFMLDGVEGRMLRPLGLAYVVAISASLIVALTVTPALASYLLTGPRGVPAGEDTWIVSRLKSAYEGVLSRVVHRPVVVSGVAAVLVIGAASLVPGLGRGFLPEFQEGTLVVSAITVPGTSLELSDQLGRRIEEVLLSHPAVRETARRTGRAELDEHAQGANAAEIDVRLDLTDREYDEVVSELRRMLAIVPGTQVTIGQPIGHRIDHMLSGTRASIAVSIFGPELNELRSLAQRIEDVVDDVPGTVDVAAEQQADVPQVRLAEDRLALAAHGLTPHDVAETIDVALGGEAVAQVFEQQRPIDLVVRMDERFRSSVEAISRIRVAAAGGGSVALGDLGQIRRDVGPNVISRENVQRKIVVQSNVSGRDVGSVVRDMQQAIDGITLPDGYHVEYGGQFQSATAASNRIALVSLLSLIVIMLLLYTEFRSVWQTLIVLVNLPLSLVGGVLAMKLTDTPLNIAALVGFITLFGIAVRNGILMVSHYNHLREEGLPLDTVVHWGSMERLSPVFMTALTAGLALLPLALAGGEPGNEIQSPLATVVLGGLLTSLVLNMVVVPALYRHFAAKF